MMHDRRLFLERIIRLMMRLYVMLHYTLYALCELRQYTAFYYARCYFSFISANTYVAARRLYYRQDTPAAVYAIRRYITA